MYSSGLSTLKLGVAPPFDHCSYQSFILVTSSIGIDQLVSKQENLTGYNKQPVLAKFVNKTKKNKIKKKYINLKFFKNKTILFKLEIFKKYININWKLEGIHKKKDKLNLSKKYYNKINAYIYGSNRVFFTKNLKGKIKYQVFENLKDAIKKVWKITKKNRSINQTILFSPSAASFDMFKNFEDRGHYFNKLIKKHLHGK